MKRITIVFGRNETTIETDASTVGAVLRNPNIAAVLGYDASNVTGAIGGLMLLSDAPLGDGDRLTVVTKAHEKA